MSWNRPKEVQKVEREVRGGKSRKVVFAVLGVVALVGAVVAWFVLSPSESPREGEDETATKKIKEVKPAAAPTNRTEVVTNSVPKRRDRNAGAKTYIDEHGVKRYEGGARYFDPNAPRRKPVRVAEPGIFKNYAENQIYALLSIEPGETLFCTRKYDKRFMDAFKKSLDEKIEILETDSEYDRAAKEAMIETKEDLRKRMEAGEDICALMQETYSEICRLAQYKRDIKKMVQDAIKEKGDMTDNDYNDLFGAANKMLAEKGIAPIRNTVLMKKNIKLHYQQKKGAEK